ncbi:AlpA family phage regulatory protein [Phenylobacterium sp.]|uniref:helix-turn-helix transcriptional regulator n=1 Tax=Phenylobacterium sp. TaxID=1871053 RepID=UPI0025D8C47C|nr:AlpA family phage regulatory protein [Phenylobacterium sp.]
MTDPKAADHEPPRDRLLAWKQVKALTGLSRTTVWRRQRAGDFPLPLVISPGRIGWRESEVEAWVRSRRQRGAASPDPPAPAPPAALPRPVDSPPFARPPSSPKPRRPNHPAGRTSRRRGAANQIHFEF